MPLKGTVWRVFPLIALIALGASFHSTPGSAQRSSLNIKFLGGIFLGHQGPKRRDIPDRNFMQVTFFCCFRQGVAGMSRDLGRDITDLETLYAPKLWADFSYPNEIAPKSFEFQNEVRNEN